MNPTREPIKMPELGIEDAEWRLSVWLVPLRASVAEGDRLVEVVAGQAVVDLPAPCEGLLDEKTAREDQVVQAGEILGWIERPVDG